MTTVRKVSKPPMQLVSLPEAARLLGGCSERTVRRWISEGRLRAYRIGPRFIRLDLAEVEAMLSPIPTAEAKN
jgi:excisionase family DNA binding protein